MILLVPPITVLLSGLKYVIQPSVLKVIASNILKAGNPKA